MCNISIEPKDIATGGISVAALIISYINFRRDSPHLLLHASIGNVVSLMYPTSAAELSLYICITNDRRRSVIVKSIGFDKSNWIIRQLEKFWPETFKPISVWWTPQGSKSPLNDLMFEPGYSSLIAPKQRKYAEGDSVNTTISMAAKEDKAFIQDMFTNAKTMYVEDTTGVRHYLPNRHLRKIIYDLSHAGSVSPVSTT